jgi:hypothetical protein
MPIVETPLGKKYFCDLTKKELAAHEVYKTFGDEWCVGIAGVQELPEDIRRDNNLIEIVVYSREFHMPSLKEGVWVLQAPSDLGKYYKGGPQTRMFQTESLEAVNEALLYACSLHRTSDLCWWIFFNGRMVRKVRAQIVLQDVNVTE